VTVGKTPEGGATGCHILDVVGKMKNLMVDILDVVCPRRGLDVVVLQNYNTRCSMLGYPQFIFLTVVFC